LSWGGYGNRYRAKGLMLIPGTCSRILLVNIVAEAQLYLAMSATDVLQTLHIVCILFTCATSMSAI
jgi:hypothetical protein